MTSLVSNEREWQMLMGFIHQVCLGNSERLGRSLQRMRLLIENLLLHTVIQLKRSPVAAPHREKQRK